MVRDRRWGSDDAVEDDVGEGLQEGGSVALVAVAEEGVHKHRRHHPPSRATPRCPARTWPVAGVRSTRPGSCRHWPGRTIRAAAPERRQGLAPTTGPAATLLRSPADVSPTPMGTAGSRAAPRARRRHRGRPRGAAGTGRGRGSGRGPRGRRATHVHRPRSGGQSAPLSSVPDRRRVIGEGVPSVAPTGFEGGAGAAFQEAVGVRLASPSCRADLPRFGVD
jgi:hypothetical protein